MLVPIGPSEPRMRRRASDYSISRSAFRTSAAAWVSIRNPTGGPPSRSTSPWISLPGIRKSNMSIRILLADDHRILREGLRSLLAQQPDVSVVGEASGGEEVVALARQLRPDVVIMDVVMPAPDGVPATRLIREELPATKVIALSMHSDRRFVSEMVRAGAQGYLVKDSAFEELNQAVRTVMADRPYLSAAITGTLVEDFVRQASSQERTPLSPLHMLTAREQEVLRLLADGKRVKEIAHMLNISTKTVESHRQNVMDKLEIHSTIELTRYALREGLTSI